MTKNKHTPGPWRRVGCTVQAGTDALHHTLVATCDTDIDPSVQEANAALIAQAPDLLEMLKGLVDNESGCALTKHARSNINALISKAEGKS